MTIFNLEIHGNACQDSRAVGMNLIALPSKIFSPEFKKRWCQEITLIEQMGLTGPFLELHRLAQDLKQSGHQLKVVGAAAGSAILHAWGLSSLCPVTYGFYTERFLAPKPEISKSKLDLVGIVSQSGIDFLHQLHQRNYAIRKEKEIVCINGVNENLEWIGATRLATPGNGRLHLQITGSSNLTLANFLSEEEALECLQDSKTWELIGEGDTNGIEGLDEPNFQQALRERKPKTLEELGSMMVAHGPGRGGESGKLPVYQEDLMALLNQDAGIPLREAYELIRTVAKSRLNQVTMVKEKIFWIAQRNGFGNSEIQNVWEKTKTKSRLALCKAHVFSNALYCLQAAFVKARHRNVFLEARPTLHERSNNRGS